ncbi:MAG: hypothetical protein J5910_05245 [Lachnospiraceae bacterium]|nr:hypothetical protein [Lachnospiraceae bacterium]
MLQILDEKVERTEESIEQQYKGCMFIIINYTDLQNPRGNLYCISTKRDSYHDICKKADELESEGVPCILAGNYADTVGPGLVYEMGDSDVHA